MPDIPFWCQKCHQQFPNLEQKEQHMKGSHRHTNSVKRVPTKISAVAPQFGEHIKLRRSKDFYYYCPIRGCDYRDQKGSVLKQHCLSTTHQPLLCKENFKKEVKKEVKRKMGAFESFTYQHILPSDFKFDHSDVDSRPASPSPADSSVNDQANDTQTSNTTSASRSPSPPSTSSANKRKAEPATANEDLMASLRAEYKKRLHEEMMESLADKGVDFKESARRREEMREWFEEGMRMLREVDGVEV
ncbi:hypothetical protein BJ508DRAFT_313777 [Ascobolus immersus RN42]|uniref:C2H2-type domain-containing protein n=1 Tax=Ascobolus immersus RN42 TaxID=1160509 RepID=A0A3N4HHH0_ASCIM|nr:hypothetical protein BJ508DRAFT_313777 [Ascobolus immersus RN42]